MDRLTQRINDRSGTAVLVGDLEEKYTAEELIDVLLARLAEYEDTGYSPNGVIALAEKVKKGTIEDKPSTTEKTEGSQGELAPCPFCGGKPYMQIRPTARKTKIYSVKCQCGAMHRFVDRRYKAVDQWNGRV